MILHKTILYRPFSIVFILLASLFFHSCNNVEDDLENRLKKLSGMNYPNYLEPNSGLSSIVGESDTLKIIVEFDECGEWGGRKEYIHLYRNDSRELIGRYLIDTVSCDRIIEKDGIGILDDKERVIVKDTIKHISKEDEMIFNNFIHRLLELTINFDYSFSNYRPFVQYLDSGNRLEVIHSDSLFHIQFTNLWENSNTWYGYIKKEVFNDNWESPRSKGVR